MTAYMKKKNAQRHLKMLLYNTGKAPGGRKLLKNRLIKKFWKAVDNYCIQIHGEICE
jgi:hypothetical protein